MACMHLVNACLMQTTGLLLNNDKRINGTEPIITVDCEFEENERPIHSIIAKSTAKKC